MASGKYPTTSRTHHSMLIAPNWWLRLADGRRIFKPKFPGATPFHRVTIVKSRRLSRRERKIVNDYQVVSGRPQPFPE
jgi:hypothetical protein